MKTILTTLIQNMKTIITIALTFIVSVSMAQSKKGSIATYELLKDRTVRLTGSTSNQLFISQPIAVKPQIVFNNANWSAWLTIHYPNINSKGIVDSVILSVNKNKSRVYWLNDSTLIIKKP